ncbi:MAG: hypothetical protein ACLQF0_10820 [Dissulfurispiraceae bacterium]
MAREKKKERGFSTGYSYVYRKRRSKTDWSGIGIGDAFKSNLDYYLRMPAQRTFYKMVRKAQICVARLDDAFAEAAFEPRVKPQLSPCYTTYPSTLAAYAAIGLTAFLEFEALVGEKILFIHLQDYVNNPAGADGVRVNEDIYKEAANSVTDCVQTRLLLENLSRIPSLSSVELYRLFSASQQDLRLASLTEIIRVVILYGDVLPDFKKQQLYPLTSSIFEDLISSSSVFFERLRKCEVTELLKLGSLWVRTVCAAMSKYMPAPADDNEQEPGNTTVANPGSAGSDATEREWAGFPEPLAKSVTDEIAPLNGPQHPMISEPDDTLKCTTQGLLTSVFSGNKHQNSRGKNPKFEEPLQEVLNNFSCVMEKAGKQENDWEDMRSDLVETSMRVNAFNTSPIQGNPADGNEVSVLLGTEKNAVGEIFDRPVELSEDMMALDKLLEESYSIIQSLRQNLYPNIQMVSETIRLRCSGSIDPSRIVLTDFSPVVFKRYRTTEQADLRGRPVLVIACDGSGSLNEKQMKMVKILSAGWLCSTAGSEIQVLAGLYHSDEIREGMSGPIVQWIYHPRKAQASSRKDAVRAIVSLPDTGTGVQSDALSIAFIIEEARLLAKAVMIYLILITDTKWNNSFHKGMSGAEEVHSYFESTNKVMNGKLDATLVALGVSADTGFEDVVNRVIAVSDGELNNCAVVAEKIGSYVASCMKERSRLLRAR